MKPSDYIPNEPERKTLHEFICASVAACIASIYPRADPERFVKIVNRTKAPACAVKTEYPPPSARASEAIAALDDELAARLRAFLKDCRCPCCDARKRLAERSARAITDPNEVTVVYSDHNAKESIGAAVVQAVRAAAEVCREPQDSGPRPAGTD